MYDFTEEFGSMGMLEFATTYVIVLLFISQEPEILTQEEYPTKTICEREAKRKIGKRLRWKCVPVINEVDEPNNREKKDEKKR